MLKAELLMNPDSCLSKAADDEPLFVIRAKDACGAATVRAWVAMSTEHHEIEKRNEALKVANDMQAWRQRNAPAEEEERIAHG